MLAQVAELNKQRMLAEIIKERKALELRREAFFTSKDEQDALKKKWGFAYYGISPIPFPAEE